MRQLMCLFIPIVCITLNACNQPKVSPQTGATAATAQAMAESIQSLDLTDHKDTEDASRGLIARPSGTIKGPDGQVLIDFSEFGFIQGDAPATVHPSLWRHAGHNAQAGLFKVTDGIYQLRGFDLANLTLIEGKTGWILIDPLTSAETASAALAFARQHLGNIQVSAIIYTHSHVDHFGGVLGVITEQEARERAIPIVAPAGFMSEATSENVLVGPAMARRSIYQFGKNLSAGPTGLVDTGLGKRVGYGSIGILPPTHSIDQPRQSMLLDGVEFIFHNMPGAEAPAELTFSLPAFNAYGGAELLSQTMHNFLPVRGAKVRDALLWSSYMQQALDQLGTAEVYFGQHNWPLWGHQRIREFITKHRDLYKYLHDQTIRLANAGYTPREIADEISLPQSLASYFGTRGYYGDLRHNVKAIYQLYLGAYDGNPATLNLLPPAESASRYIDLMGGSDKVVQAAQKAFDHGDYRWVAELLNHVMFTDPGHSAGKELLIRTYQQLAFQSEAATWRNSYLTAADELLQGPPTQGVKRQHLLELMQHTPTERFLEAMAASLNGPAADGKQLIINLVLTDTRESYVLWLENAVLHHRSGTAAADANATLKISKLLLVRLLIGAVGVAELMKTDEMELTGSRLDFLSLLRLIEKAPDNFAIVTAN
ncbi:alkyl/aryl-sulfatase [Rheinheimera marina]|uniref:Alkyl/aryl-sulfatase n=1 Tax=Rheinheimera marina TaxID=1774958 RepID=A0ABV9JM80_9GAMM